MVSLWLPSGQNRAKDIIRSNDGQCHGTHPNVPAISNSINPSLGWHHDGSDDLIDCGNHISIYNAVKSGTFSVGLWLKTLEVIGTDYRAAFGLYKDANNRVHFEYPRKSYAKATMYATINGSTASDEIVSVVDTDWHCIISTFAGTAGKHYVDGSLTKSGTEIDFANFVGMPTFYIGVCKSAVYFYKGYNALPFIAKSAWSLAQQNNFYLQTKGLFSPRG